MKGTLTILLAALALVLVPMGSAENSYSDPVGDAGSGPDISAVNVSNTEAGVVTVRITVPLEPWTLVFMAIDADRNPSTGNELGLEGMIAVLMGGGPSDLLAAALDKDGDELPGVSIAATFVDGVLELSFPREAFSIDQGFAFGYISARVEGGEPVLGDMAPADPCMTLDVPCSQLWVYELVSVAPLPAPPVVVVTPAPVVRPVIGKPAATPKKPIAGKRFTVRVPVTRSDNRKPLTKAVIVCKTKVAGKLVRHRHTFRKGTLTATLIVPKAAKGKRLSIGVAVTTKSSDQMTARKVFTYKVTR